MPRAFSFRSDAKFDAKTTFLQCSFRPQSTHWSSEVVLACVTPEERRSLARTPKRIKVRFCLGVKRAAKVSKVELLEDLLLKAKESGKQSVLKRNRAHAVIANSDDDEQVSVFDRLRAILEHLSV